MAEVDDRLPTWCGRDGWCPMVATSAVLSRKWHPVILHRLLEYGPLRFGELDDHIPEVSGKVLSESLSDLEDKGLLDRTVTDAKPIHVEYALTQHGAALESAITELHTWGQTHLRNTTDPDDSII